MSEKLENQKIPDDVLAQLGDRYSKYKYISSGATSSVYQAHDAILDKTIALKILKHPDQKVLMRFQQEAKALSQLEHPNLVQILDFNITTKNHAYLIMEFVKGEDLSSIQQKTGALSVDQAKKIVIQVCKGMAHAHSKNITHRDLKTSNIIVDNIDNPKVTIVDFGLAVKQAQDDTIVQNFAQTEGFSTTSGTIQGSPHFMSPEQAQGKDIDCRSDIYSLGCILFKLLTGQTPFQSDELMDVLRKHVKETAPKLIDVNRDLGNIEELEKVVAKMLAKAPKDRYQSMDEVQTAISDKEFKEDIIGDTTFIPAKKNESQLIYIGFGLITVISAIVIFFILNERPKDYYKPEEIKTDRRTMVKDFFRLTHNTSLNINDQDYWYTPTIKGAANLQDSDFEYVKDEIKSLKLEKKKIELEKQTKTKKDSSPIDIPLYTNKLNLKNTKISGAGLKLLINSGIERLDLTNTNLETSAYDYLAKFEELKILILDQSSINSAGLNKLWQSKSIEELRINTCPNITDNGFSDIHKCSKLIHLSIGNEKQKKESVVDLNKNITDKTLENLSKSKTLRYLNLDGTMISDTGIQFLLSPSHRKRNQLKSLNVDFCPGITGKTLKLFSELNPTIKYLGISHTSIEPEDLKLISNFKNLTTLNLAGIDIDDETLKAIGNLNHMKFLYMARITAHESSLKYLKKLNQLDTITMTKAPNISSSAIDDLEKSFPDNVVFLMEGRTPHRMKDPTIVLPGEAKPVFNK